MTIEIERNVHTLYNEKIDRIREMMLDFFEMRLQFIEIMQISGKAFCDLNRIAEELENEIYDFQDFCYAEEVKNP